MSSIWRERLRLRQGNGPDIELVVTGDEDYAHYETPTGFPVIYDEGRGLFCFARLLAGAFVSTGVPASDSPPSDCVQQQEEAPEVRSQKAAAKRAARGGRP